MTKQLQGLLIVGADEGCGKTVVASGLAAAISETGFRVHAWKPLDFADSPAGRPVSDQAFMNQVTQQMLPVETLYAPSAWDVTPVTWARWLEPCKNLQFPCLFEAPGQVASPWQIQQGVITDACDVAHQLGLSVILVGAAGPQFLAKTREAMTYLFARKVHPKGFVRVSTQPGADAPHPADALLISQTTGVPFLGDLPYSPSVSVPGLKQGNLIRLLGENIDLFPLQLEMGLKL
jgi:dethiobiotin synthetase